MNDSLNPTPEQEKTPELLFWIKENSKLRAEIDSLNNALANAEQRALSFKEIADIQKQNTKKALERTLKLEGENFSMRGYINWCYDLLAPNRDKMNEISKLMLDSIKQFLYENER